MRFRGLGVSRFGKFVFELVEVELAEAVDCEAGIAYGRWALAWKHDKVAQIAKTGSYACLYPTGWDGEIAE